MSKSILIIEDDLDITDVMVELLSSNDIELDSVTNVDDAIKFLTQKNYDLIILDINLSGRNGAEVLKNIAFDSENTNKSTPVLISSGIITELFIKNNQNKFAGIISKPFNHDLFKENVDRILNPPDLQSKIQIFTEIASEEINKSNDHTPDVPNIVCTLPYTVPELQAKVNKIIELVNKNTKLKDLFNKLKINRGQNSFLEEHIGLVINISTAISIALEWSTEKTLEKFVYAAYLHDMALNSRQDLAQTLAEKPLFLLKSELVERDFNILFQHPNIAADFIEKILEIPPEVSLIIRQHHENGRDTGFPNKPSPSKITPLSTIFIVAVDLSYFILTTPEWTVENYISKIKSKFKGPHFNKVIQVLFELS